MSSASPPPRTRPRFLDVDNNDDDDDRSRSHPSSSTTTNKRKDRASSPSSTSRRRSPDPRSKHTHARRSVSPDDDARAGRRAGRPAETRSVSRSPDPRSKHTHARRSVSPDDKERSWRRREHRHRHRRERSKDPDRERDRERERRRRHRSRSRDDGSRRRRDDERHSRRSQQGRSRSRSRDPKRRKPAASPPPASSSARSKAPLPSQDAAYRSTDNALDKPIEKQAPNFSQTGLLAKETNTVAGTSIVLKYHEPSDARKPPVKDAWRLYVFKNADVLATHELSGRSCWLFGREALIADVVLEHPSASKQHAALQFRHTVRVSEFGDREQKVRPYLIDLESSNGSFLNGERIDAGRFVEIRNGDVLKFGDSTREYVVMLPPPG